MLACLPDDIDVVLLPSEGITVRRLVAAHVGVGVEHVRIVGKVVGALLQEEPAAVRVVRQIEAHLVTDTVQAEAPVQSLYDLDVLIRLADIAVRLVERSDLLYAGIALVLNKMLDNHGEVLGKLLIVSRSRHPVRPAPVT